MKTKLALVIFLLGMILLSTTFLVNAQSTLAPPSVTLPTNWQLSDSTSYPQLKPAIQDPAGAGMLAYADQTGDSVIIIYEKVQENYDLTQLEQYANVFFNALNLANMNEGNPLVDSHSNAGFDGFAEGMNTTTSQYIRVLVLTRGSYFITIEAIYTYNTMNDAFSILGSLTVPSGSATTATPPPATAAPTTTSAPGTSSLAPPKVSLPNGWTLANSKAYPDWPYAIYDPAGSGMISYNDQSGDAVAIQYEKTQGSHTSTQLQDEANAFFEGANLAPLDSSGTATYAGVTAGYAEGFNSTSNQYWKAVVFTKGDYFIAALSAYNSQGSANADAIVNSINAANGGSNSSGGSSPLGNATLLIIVGVVAAIIVVMVVVVMMKKRKALPPPPPPQPTMQ